MPHSISKCNLQPPWPPVVTTCFLGDLSAEARKGEVRLTLERKRLLGGLEERPEISCQVPGLAEGLEREL